MKKENTEYNESTLEEIEDKFQNQTAGKEYQKYSTLQRKKVGQKPKRYQTKKWEKYQSLESQQNSGIYKNNSRHVKRRQSKSISHTQTGQQTV